MDMEFRQAEHFLAVVEHGGVVRAAAALHLAQPSLSQSIRVLERDLGIVLFHRVGRGLVPTAAGAALVDPARQLLRDVATAAASVAELSGLHGGHVDIGATAGAYDSPLPELIGGLRRDYPTVTVRLSEYLSESEVARAVRGGRVELGFGYLGPDDSDDLTEYRDLESHRLGTDELCVALPREIADTLPDPLPFERLPELPVIGVSSGALGRIAIEAALRHASRRTRLGVVTAHRQAAVPLVAAGAGMAWVTRAIADNAGEAGVVARAMEPPVRLTMGVVHRRGVLSPAARALLDAALRRRDRQDRTDAG
ncbi:LysR family transcriptional regulator [Rhodococcus sp. SC4]|nr:LysR family transcriptional regulator [Rhodococcus sp. SC4]